MNMSPEEKLLGIIQEKPQSGEMVRIQQVIQAIDQEPEYPGNMPDEMKQAFGGNTALIEKALKYTVSLTKKSIRKRVEALNPVKPLKIELYQHDWTPGFAAFNDDGSIQNGAPAHISLDLGAFMASLQEKDLEKQDLPYVIAESIMHEIIHAIESWANVEFNEEKVEALLQKYRDKYKNCTPVLGCGEVLEIEEEVVFLETARRTVAKRIDDCLSKRNVKEARKALDDYEILEALEEGEALAYCLDKYSEKTVDECLKVLRGEVKFEVFVSRICEGVPIPYVPLYQNEKP